MDVKTLLKGLAKANKYYYDANNGDLFFKGIELETDIVTYLECGFEPVQDIINEHCGEVITEARKHSLVRFNIIQPHLVGYYVTISRAIAFLADYKATLEVQKGTYRKQKIMVSDRMVTKLGLPCPAPSDWSGSLSAEVTRTVKGAHEVDGWLKGYVVISHEVVRVTQRYDGSWRTE